MGRLYALVNYSYAPVRQLLPKNFQAKYNWGGEGPHMALTGKVLKAGVTPAYTELIVFTTFHQNSINTGEIGLK